MLTFDGLSVDSEQLLMPWLGLLSHGHAIAHWLVHLLIFERQSDHADADHVGWIQETQRTAQTVDVNRSKAGRWGPHTAGTQSPYAERTERGQQTVTSDCNDCAAMRCSEQASHLSLMNSHAICANPPFSLVSL